MIHHPVEIYYHHATAFRRVSLRLFGIGISLVYCLIHLHSTVLYRQGLLTLVSVGPAVPQTVFDPKPDMSGFEILLPRRMRPICLSLRSAGQRLAACCCCQRLCMLPAAAAACGTDRPNRTY